MKIRKFIPLISACSIGAVLAPTVLTSCNKYTNINLLQNYTPSKGQKAPTKFASLQEANNYYARLSKEYFIEDYVWTRSAYIQEGMEYPTPLLPYKFVNLDKATLAVENWWTDYDSKHPNYFLNSFEIVYKIAGQTKPREEPQAKMLAANSSYIDNSYANIELTIKATKVPCTLNNDRIDGNGIERTQWYCAPISAPELSVLDYWQVSGLCDVVYTKRNSYDESISASESVRVHWYKDYWYDEQRDSAKSYLYTLIYSTLTFDSYHLKQCTL